MSLDGQQVTIFKDLAQGISAVASASAIVIGGAWAYWKFGLHQERTPRAEFDLSAEFTGLQNGVWLIEISARLANKGKVRHQVTDATLNVRYLTVADRVTESTESRHARQVVFPHSIGRRNIWGTQSYLDPGLEVRNSYVTWVPEGATYVLLLCKFKYGGEVWPAQRLIAVPETKHPSSNPPAESLVPRPGESLHSGRSEAADREQQSAPEPRSGLGDGVRRELPPADPGAPGEGIPAPDAPGPGSI